MGQGNLAKMTWSTRLLEIVTKVSCRQKRQNMQSNKCMAETCLARFLFVLDAAFSKWWTWQGKKKSLFHCLFYSVLYFFLFSPIQCPKLPTPSGFLLFGFLQFPVAPLPSCCTASTARLCRAVAKALTVVHVQRSNKRGGK